MARYGEIRPVNFFGNFLAGRQAAQEEQDQQQASELRGLQVQRAQGLNALAQNPNATPEQYIRAGDAQTGNALLGAQQQQQGDRQQALTQLAGLAQKALSIQDPAQRKAFLASPEISQVYGPAFHAIGADHGKGLAELQQLPDGELQQRLSQVAQFAPQKQESFTLSEGQQRFDANGKVVASVSPKPEKPQISYRQLTPEEIKARGLPEGTSAQIDSTGKVDILNKREGLSAAEQKTIRDAKMRLPRLNATVRRVDRLGQAVDSLAQNIVFDGGPMDQMALRYTKQGQEIQAAAAQLMPELQALTRVPGIGSQSDLEARLASLALPSLEMSPEVNKKSQAELKAFIDDLKSAYESLANGGQPPASASGGWTIQEVK